MQCIDTALLEVPRYSAVRGEVLENKKGLISIESQPMKDVVIVVVVVFVVVFVVNIVGHKNLT